MKRRKLLKVVFLRLNNHHAMLNINLKNMILNFLYNFN